jgi:hypothetical protein
MGKLINKYVLKHFYRFLKHNNIIEDYFINFTSLHNITWRESYGQEKAFDIYAKDRLSQSKPQLIQFAFDWEESEEGFDFWEDMNKLWEKEYDRITKKYLCQ